ncbi:hypothetical protein IEQ34_006979 [Dendrobium chrysotoxum]|uniref:Uncharacterized protein n=1 Tax=Dendrobium chrysotoxum TaxID=161865 RepID=A0AAV7H9P8_DENCH|nr:hypothetical protein IEQ34_006979 [Dendrobium chrysotoxum]
MVGRSPVNLSIRLLLLSNMTIMRAAFGKGSAQQKKFLLAMKKTLKYLSGFNVVDLFPSLLFLAEIMSTQGLDGVLNEIIEENEKKLDGFDTNEDLVDDLLRIKTSGEIDLSLIK